MSFTGPNPILHSEYFNQTFQEGSTRSQKPSKRSSDKNLNAHADQYFDIWNSIFWKYWWHMALVLDVKELVQMSICIFASTNSSILRPRQVHITLKLNYRTLGSCDLKYITWILGRYAPLILTSAEGSSIEPCTLDYYLII